MRKYLVVTVCVVALIIFSTIAVYAQGNQGDKALGTKIDSLKNDVKLLNAKLDEVLENQQKIVEELKSVKIFIRRM